MAVKTKTAKKKTTKAAQQKKKNTVAPAAQAAKKKKKESTPAAVTTTAKATGTKKGGSTTTTVTTVVAPTVAPAVTAASDAGMKSVTESLGVDPKYTKKANDVAFETAMKTLCSLSPDLKGPFYFDPNQKNGVSEFNKVYATALGVITDALKDLKSEQLKGIHHLVYPKLLIQLLAKHLGQHFIVGPRPGSASANKIPVADVLKCLRSEPILVRQFTAAQAMNTSKSETEVLESVMVRPLLLEVLRKLSEERKYEITVDHIDFKPEPIPAESESKPKKKKNNQDAAPSEPDDSSSDDDNSGKSSDSDSDEQSVHSDDAKATQANIIKDLTVVLARWREVDSKIHKGADMEHEFVELWKATAPFLKGLLPKSSAIPGMVHVTFSRVYQTAYEIGKISADQRNALAFGRSVLLVAWGDYHTGVLFVGLSRIVMESFLENADKPEHRAFAIKRTLAKRLRPGSAPVNVLELCGHVGNLLLSLMEAEYRKDNDDGELHAGLRSANGYYQKDRILLIEAYAGKANYFKNLLILVPAIARALLYAPNSSGIGDLAGFEKNVLSFCLVLYSLFHGNALHTLSREGQQKAMTGFGYDSTILAARADDAASTSCALFKQAMEMQKQNDASGFASRAKIPGPRTARRQREPTDDEADDDISKTRFKIVDISKVLDDANFGDHGLKITELKVGAPCMWHGHGGKKGPSHKTENCNTHQGLNRKQMKKIQAVVPTYPVTK